MGVVQHAIEEFKILGWDDEDDEMQMHACANVLELLEVFANQGHSGFSAQYITNLFNKLARFKTIAPLTGEDSEWTEVRDGVYQNKRQSAVFKENGKAYWIDGKVFEDRKGGWFTNSKSRVGITFPWIQPEESAHVRWWQFWRKW